MKSSEPQDFFMERSFKISSVLLLMSRLLRFSISSVSFGKISSQGICSFLPKLCQIYW